MVPSSYIFCYWIWLWTILYTFNIIKQSPLPASVGALVYTVYAVFFSHWSNKFPWDFKIFISLFETLVVFYLIYKSKNLSKDFVKLIPFNLFVFLVYLAYIYTQNKTFSEIYFKDLPNQEAYKKGLVNYQIKRLNYIKKELQL
tara:strand:+ start:5009 stop:5437 length:429 start_codon:yes stop_codon:yes gene_type:complete